MDLRSRRRALMAAQEVGRLPAAYQEVEWIQSSGTQKIYTDYEPAYSDLVNMSMTVEFLMSSTSTSKAAIVAGFSDWGGEWVGLMTNAKIGLGNNIYFSNVTPTTRNTFVMTWDSSKGYLTCNGTKIGRAISDGRSMRYCLFNVYEPYCPGSDFPSKARFFYAKILKNNVPMVELIPCYRKRDSVIGVYDIVNKKFYSNVGTGTFTKGADVT